MRVFRTSYRDKIDDLAICVVRQDVIRITHHEKSQR